MRCGRVKICHARVYVYIRLCVDYVCLVWLSGIGELIGLDLSGGKGGGGRLRLREGYGLIWPHSAIVSIVHVIVMRKACISGTFISLHWIAVFRATD